MHTDKRPTSGSGRENGGRDEGQPARDAYDDERDEAIDADPQLREIGRARLRKRADRASGGEKGGGARR
ncbi:hypothetical protein OG946_08805 [Streptomyces sp. NBC_01808]|uniref:hypothetical protein n=1 Tax=Streptomyces sp. NBC_01808 TaxID=2975947 RepID=UPI002DD7E792|nr:hypothetical protein [Streptomyces sp. NBC_01808]WSA37471.1 hypothetical protein OG946_08805 [Streptomyces sp. NBC_01808]